MTALALQEIAKKSEEAGLDKKKDGIDLFYYLLKPTTTAEMLEPLREIFFDKIKDNNHIRMQFLTRLQLH